MLAHVRTYGVDALITRGSNTYGPNQYPEKLIPLFVTNAIEGEPLPLYGDGRQVRDWLYVEDHCAGIELVAPRGRGRRGLQRRRRQEHENIEVTRRILELTGADASLIRQVADRAGHDRRYSLDYGEARGARLAPKHSFDGPACRRRSRWYREHRGWWEPIKHSDDYRAYYRSQYADPPRRLSPLALPRRPVTKLLRCLAPGQVPRSHP